MSDLEKTVDLFVMLAGVAHSYWRDRPDVLDEAKEVFTNGLEQFACSNDLDARSCRAMAEGFERHLKSINEIPGGSRGSVEIVKALLKYQQEMLRDAVRHERSVMGYPYE